MLKQIVKLRATAKLSQFISKISTATVEKGLMGDLLNGAYYGSTALPNTLSEVNINVRNAETINAFYACLRVKAETMAAIKTCVNHHDGNKKQRALDHQVDYLLSEEPNATTSAYNFWYSMQLIEDLWGNAFAEIKTNKGEVDSVHLLPAWEVSIIELANGSLVYQHKGRMIASRSILHFKQNSLDGKTGRSIVRIQKEQLGLAKKQENYAAKMVGSKPTAVFEGGEHLNSTTAQEAAQSFAENIKKGVIPVAFGGLKYKDILRSAGDIQLFEMKGATTSEILGMFRMPASKIGIYSREKGGTYNTVEQQNINFVQDVVLPMVAQKENECNIKLFTKEEKKQYKTYFDLGDILKADLKTQTEHLMNGWTKGIYNANEVREKLNINPIIGEHGERYYVQGAQIPVEMINEFYKGKKPQTQTNEAA